MESKRKKRKVLKVNLATPELPKSPEPQAKPQVKSTNPEYLISYNANLVEALLDSETWKDIVFPLISEGIASVSGRLTNGRYHHGDLTRSTTNKDFLSGYQKALMDFYNHLNDFLRTRDNLLASKHEEEAAKSQPIINPFLEEEDEQ